MSLDDLPLFSGPTKSREEAMDLLHHHKGELIHLARAIAKKLAQENGATHSRAVREEMRRQGHINGGRETWLGAVFNSPEFEWTGEWFQYGDEGRNIHKGHYAKVWRLK